MVQVGEVGVAVAERIVEVHVAVTDPARLARPRLTCPHPADPANPTGIGVRAVVMVMMAVVAVLMIVLQGRMVMIMGVRRT